MACATVNPAWQDQGFAKAYLWEPSMKLFPQLYSRQIICRLSSCLAIKIPDSIIIGH